MAYAKVAALRERLGAQKATKDDALRRALETAASQIDEWCGRSFTQAPAAHGGISRVYRPERSRLADVHDFVSDVNTVVERKVSREGSWETLTVDTDFIFEPLNQLFNGRTWPTDAIRIISPSTYLVANAEWTSLRVTARWGWPAVPEDIIEANLLQAAKLFDRSQSPAGTLGVDGFGATVRVQSGLDRDAATILEPFRRVFER